MNSAVYCLLFVASVALAGNVDFTPCPSQQLATITRFSVSDCDDGSPHCTFVKGRTYEFDIAGQSHFGGSIINALYYKVVARVLGVDIPLLNGDACDNMTAPYECPINPGEQINWVVDRLISDTAPSVNNVDVFARIWANNEGANDAAIGCASIKVTITNAADLKHFIASVRKIE